jgi:hypothetical protein
VADEDRALFVAGIEAAVTDAYRAALEQQSVPADLADTVLVLAQHHDEHCAALAAIALKARTDVAPNPRLFTEVTELLRLPDARTTLLDIEEALAATHLESMGVLTDTLAAASVASILPVEAQHAVVLDPSALPEVQTTDGAYDERAYGS